MVTPIIRSSFNLSMFWKKKFSTNDSNFHHPMIGVPTWPRIGGIFQILLIGGLEHLFSLIYFP